MMLADGRSFEDCGGPYDLTDRHTISSWEERATTCAEQAVIQYLSVTLEPGSAKSLLHIGIGNGSLFDRLRYLISDYTGITISQPESDRSIAKFSHIPHTRFIVANKHDNRNYDAIGYGFDIIVDVNLRSFACCEKHFSDMMQYFAKALADGGALFTAESGLNFGWAGNTQVAYTPGSDTDPDVSVHRVLGAIGLAQLSNQLGLQAESIEVFLNGECGAETIWMLRKV